MRGHLFRFTLGCAALIGIASSSGLCLAGGFARPYTVSVENVSTKVGEKAVLVAKLTLPDGYNILDAYNNRLVQLSSYDDGVAFERAMVLGKVENRGLTFTVGVTPTKPGAHPINGVFRVGYYKDDRMDMVSLPLIATVTGTE
jgi:hypothetical protein